MSGIIIFILRLLLATALYAFVGWALYTLWRELQLQAHLIHPKRTPPIRILVISGAPDEERQFTQAEIILGRDAACDFPLSHETVSARHAKISYHHSQWWVEDLRATNGTYLNDQRVEIPTVLVNGDELRCGQMILEIHDTEK